MCSGGGSSRQCGWFNGIDARIEIADDAGWQFGEGAFTVSAGVRLPSGAHPYADLVSKFDPAARNGFHEYHPVMAVMRRRQCLPCGVVKCRGRLAARFP